MTDTADASKEAKKAKEIEEREEKQAVLRREIMRIMCDASLSEEEKSRRRQQLMMGGPSKPAEDNSNKPGSSSTPAKRGKQQAGQLNKKRKKKGDAEEESEEASEQQEEAQQEEEQNTFLDDTLKCAMCMDLCERPVTAPCQHNFCLVCFNKWRAQAKYKCPTCRADFPKAFAQNPRINTALILAIRLAKNPPKDRPAPVQRRVEEDRPDEAYVTDRAVRSGRANASSGRMMVTAPPDHFGPIGPEYDPERNQGILVGEWWQDRLDCRQWGAHRPHVAGIAGQSGVGAQSVVLSGGYEDDRDEGEWFLYTGSGGKDLSGNKRTNKVHSSDQKFEMMNKALQVSCILGLPVRVVRSFKEKRSAYAPTQDTPVRYDGVYRILRCWRKKGQNEDQHLICRYLFVRADNSPAPWSSAEVGDQGEQSIPEEAQPEINEAVGKVFEMGQDPYWAFLPDQDCWGWLKPQPASKKLAGPGRSSDPTKKLKKQLSEHEKVLKGFRCELCKKTSRDPMLTPCAHTFCKGCLEAKFVGVEDIQHTNSARSLRVRHVAKPCPCCKADLASFLQMAQVNREMASVIEKIEGQVAEAKQAMEKALEEAAQAKGSNEGEDDDEEEEGTGEGEQEEEEEEEDAPGPSNRPSKAQKKQPSSTPGKAATPKAGSAPSTSKKAGKDATPAAVTAGASDADKKGSGKKKGRGSSGKKEGGKKEGEASAAAASNGGDAPPAAAPAAAANGGASISAAQPAAKAPPAYKYPKQLAAMQEQFPEIDEALVKDILEDEEGDLQYARSKLKELNKGMQKAKTPKKKPAAAAATSNGGAKANGAGSSQQQEGGEETGAATAATAKAGKRGRQQK